MRTTETEQRAYADEYGLINLRDQTVFGSQGEPLGRGNFLKHEIFVKLAGSPASLHVHFMF